MSVRPDTAAGSGAESTRDPGSEGAGLIDSPGPPIPLTSYLRDVAITCVVLGLVLIGFVGPDFFQLHTPEPYYGDGLSHGFLVKSIIDTGWFPSHSRWVGAPFGSEVLDYPFADGVNFLLIRLLALFSSNWVVVANLFFIGGYFLAAASACVVFRRLGLASPWAIAGAILFALLPYHLYRRGHLLLASYFAVPIGVYLAVVAATENPGVERSRRWWLRLGALSLIVGSTGLYYAFFSVFLVVVAGLSRALVVRSWRATGLAGGLVVAISVAVLLNVTPHLVYRVANGPNAQVAVRNPAESEINGLRITQMMLPRADHRIDAAGALARTYAVSAPMVNENQMAALGIVGTAGLVIMLVVALGRIAGAAVGSPMVALLSTFGIAALLLGTMGGLGSVLAYTLVPAIRGYNRISVVIGFLSLAIVLLFLQARLLRFRFAAPPAIAAAAAGCVIVVGALDQTPRQYQLAGNPTFASDQAFVADMQSRLPPDTAVLQLPYQPYPESGPVVKMGSYGPLRGYLNSTTLRWSYGAMKGRAADQWLRALTDRELPEMLDLAARSGFGALYVDRRGFADGGAAFEGMLRNTLGDPLAVSPDRQLAAYRLHSAGDKPLPIDAVVSIDAPIEFNRQNLGGAVDKISGFSGREAWGRWTNGPVARIEFVLPLPRRFVLKIETAMATPPNVGQDIVVKAGSTEQRFRVGNALTTVEVPMELAEPADALELTIPHPASPHELGWSEDRRKLGIGIKAITILPSK